MSRLHDASRSFRPTPAMGRLLQQHPFWLEHGSSWERAYFSAYKKLVRDRASEAQNHRCCYCGVRMTETLTTGGYEATSCTLEHVVPLAQGGTWDPDNLVAACQRCNNVGENAGALGTGGGPAERAGGGAPPVPGSSPLGPGVR